MNSASHSMASFHTPCPERTLKYSWTSFRFKFLLPFVTSTLPSLRVESLTYLVWCVDYVVKFHFQLSLLWECRVRLYVAKSSWNKHELMVEIRRIMKERKSLVCAVLQGYSRADRLVASFQIEVSHVRRPLSNISYSS